MKKQKICIIGGGLTGLITAATLSNLNLDIDIISENSNQIINSCRTTAISQENYNFLENLKFSKKIFWPCSEMKLYIDNENKFLKVFEVNKTTTKNKKVFYMVENKKLMSDLNRIIKFSKSTKLLVKKKISKIINTNLLKGIKLEKKINSHYNLIIVCTGNNSQLTKNFINEEFYRHSYDELAITTILKHEYIDNLVARQIFSDEEILALLPISNNKTSVVLSIKKNFSKRKINNILLRKKIKFYANNFFKKIEFNSNFEIKELNLSIRKKYHNERVLLFGDALHSVHPLTGQGTNMTLRDLKILKQILNNKINLGLDIGSDDVLSEFERIAKAKNFAYSLGIDFIRKSFKLKKKSLKIFRNRIMLEINKNNVLKNIFFNIANKGLRF
jgi:2-octaprenyl-6-methoxyphenol hydroxylase